MEEKIKILIEISKLANLIGLSKTNLKNYKFAAFSINDDGSMDCQYEPNDPYEDTRYIDITLEDLEKDPEQHKKDYEEKVRKDKERLSQLVKELKEKDLRNIEKNEKELYLKLKKKYEK